MWLEESVLVNFQENTFPVGDYKTRHSMEILILQNFRFVQIKQRVTNS